MPEHERGKAKGEQARPDNQHRPADDLVDPADIERGHGPGKRGDGRELPGEEYGGTVANLDEIGDVERSGGLCAEHQAQDPDTQRRGVAQR